MIKKDGSQRKTHDRASNLFSNAWQHDSWDSHCTFSTNLFHGQITQKLIDQLIEPENKECSPWIVFEINHPQTGPLLIRRSPRGLDTRLSQHYSHTSGHLGPLLFKSGPVWGWFIPKTFQGLHSLFSRSLIWRIAIRTICLWNKFEEKAQCE